MNIVADFDIKTASVELVNGTYIYYGTTEDGFCFVTSDEWVDDEKTNVTVAITSDLSENIADMLKAREVMKRVMEMIDGTDGMKCFNAILNRIIDEHADLAKTLEPKRLVIPMDSELRAMLHKVSRYASCGYIRSYYDCVAPAEYQYKDSAVVFNFISTLEEVVDKLLDEDVEHAEKLIKDYVAWQFAEIGD